MSTQRPSLVRRLSVTDLSWEVLRIAVLAVMVLLIAPPILYAISISLRPETQFTNPFYLFPPPSEIKFQWYIQSLNIMISDLKNTYLRAIGGAIIALLVAVPGAYAVARRQFPYRRFSFYWVVGVQVFPIIVIVVPLMVVYFALGINDTMIGLWLADQLFNIPFAMWVLRDFFNSMPPNLEESAQVYGCTEFGAFRRVILPLTLPALLAVGFLAFVHGWNEYIFGQLLSGQQTRVAIIRLIDLSYPGAQIHWGRGMAKTVILSAPPAALYLFARQSMQEAFAFD